MILLLQVSKCVALINAHNLSGAFYLPHNYVSLNAEIHQDVFKLQVPLFLTG